MQHFNELMNSKQPAIIKIIAAILALNGMVALVNYLGYLIYYFVNTQSTGLGFLEPIRIVMIVVCLLAAYQLWKQNKMGWILSVLFLTHAFMQAGFNAYFDWQLQQSNFAFSLVLPKGIAYYVAKSFVIIALWWYLNRKQVRAMFRVNRKEQMITIGLMVLVSLGIYFVMITMAY